MKLLLIALFACVWLAQARFVRKQNEFVNTRSLLMPKIKGDGKCLEIFHDIIQNFILQDLQNSRSLEEIL